MPHYVAYHKIDNRPYDSEHGFWFLCPQPCNKPLKFFEGAKEGRVWVITGEKKTNRKSAYQLVAFFTVSKIEDREDGIRISGNDNEGTHLTTPVDLNPLLWFRDFQRTQGNFAFGFNLINQERFIDALLALVATLKP